jgi:hypothetical protein
MESLREALYDQSASIPPLGDIDRAIDQVSVSRRRWAAGITIAVVALIAILGPWKAPALRVEPAVPEPTAPAVEVLQSGIPMDTIRRAPLPDGADVAAAQSSPGRALVWSKGQPREVASDFRIYWASLSPNGRLLAHAEQMADVLVITDLTTGAELLRWPMLTTSGKQAQSPHVVWSADGSRLLQQVIATRELGTGKSELRVWQAEGSGAFRAVGKPIPLPGALVGASPDGETVLADDSGMLTRLSVGSRTWVPLGVPSAPSDWHPGDYGQGCWSPDERYVCWVGRQSAASNRWQVGWVDLASGSGTWTVQDLGSAEWARFLGWRGTDPVVELMDPGRVTVTATTPTGLEVLRTFTFGTAVDPSANNPPDPSITVATTWAHFSSSPGTSGPQSEARGGTR